MKIEKGIPMPLSKRQGKYIKAVSLMEVGDSVLLNCKDTADNSVHAIRQAGRTIGFKMSARTMDAGVRVWRVK